MEARQRQRQRRIADGQGLFTKVAQIVAEEFGVPLDWVRITATNTAKVPNASPTAASSGTRRQRPGGDGGGARGQGPHDCGGRRSTGIALEADRVPRREQYD